MRIDFHVHSKFSRRPSQWVLQKLGSSESFSEPMQIYNIAKKKGMSLVTISDHNAIDGALEIAHLPDTFISEEITSYFPDDGCKVHDLASALKRIESGDSSVVSSSSTPKTMSHNLYGIAYQFYCKKFDMEKFIGKDILLRFLDQSLRMDREAEKGFVTKLYCLWQSKRQLRAKSNFPETLLGLLKKETHKLIHDNPRFLSIAEGERLDSAKAETEWFDFRLVGYH